jgi:hypothetical protein
MFQLTTKTIPSKLHFASPVTAERAKRAIEESLAGGEPVSVALRAISTHTISLSLMSWKEVCLKLPEGRRAEIAVS